MKKTHKGYQMISAMICCAVIASAAIRPFASSCASIRQKVLRLHILASSDSVADQALKLKVRDAVLESGEEIFQSAESKEEAMLFAVENAELLKQAAEAVCQKEGNGETCRIELCKTYFPKRVYEDGTTLPAGEYDALRVIIGEGKGHNWWCMVFPKICFSAAAGEENRDILGRVFTEEEVDITTNSDAYTVRFLLVDLWEEIVHRFCADK